MADDVRVQEGETLQLQIEKLIYGGRGLAHYESQACFVKDVIPGEQVRVTVDKVKRQYLVTSLCELLASSSNRISPLCPIIGDCGGCQWQHIHYNHQLYWKAQILKECLSRIAGLSDFIINDFIPSPSPFNYRYRATLKVRLRPVAAIGYFKEKTHELVPVRNCLQLAVPLNKALRVCWNALEAEPDFLKDIYEIQMLLIHESNQTILSLTHRKTRNIDKYLINQDSERFTTYKDIMLERVYGINFTRDSKSFYQVNYHQNLKMIHLVSEYFASITQGTILDLYCGSGNFSLFLARHGAGEVTGIDSNKCAIEEAVYNAEVNGIKNCKFKRADVNKLNDLMISSRLAGVLLNPPRSGCSRGAIKKITEVKPGIIVYVSCNPPTLARDLRVLIASGYTVREIQPIDMFPQTYHIETIVQLTR